jgi:uncharacterized membrane protein YedE/YeeE
VSGIFALVSGLLFAVGLAFAGMTQPTKVIAFLDVAGDWDPSLAMVMIGAIAVYMPLYHWAMRLRAPLVAPRFSLPTRQDIDVRLVAGAAIFGAGWGLGGYCPGPALASLGTVNTAPIVFVLAMLAGMVVFALVERAGRKQPPGA